MKGKNVLMDLLHSENVEYVFGIPGATEIEFMDALEETEGIEYILSLNEIVSAGMAEGYARASGKPGFLNLHTGPGVAAALPMLYNAYAGNVPLVITAGQQVTQLLQHDPHLSGDIVATAQPYLKWGTEITLAEDIPVAMQRAFKLAQQYPTGPVLVSIPYDILTEEIEYTQKPNTKVYPHLRPDAQAIRQAFDLIKNAKNPVILVESGVARCNAQDEAVRFAELIGARVYQGWMSDVNFPVTHPQYLWDLDPTSPPAKAVLENTDLLISIGAPMFGQGFFNPEPTLPEQLKIIQFDENPWEIGKNFPVDCGILGDIKSALGELNGLLDSELPTDAKESATSRRKEISDEKTGMTAALEEQINAEKDSQPIAISRLMSDLKNTILPDTIIVDDCWSSSAMLRRILNLTEPGSFIRSRKGGSIGSGLSMALGVKLGAPGKNVVAVSGDGSAAWNMQALWTAARYNLPVTFIITNNATYRQVKLTRKIVLGDYPLNEKYDGMELENPVIDFCKLAESMGVEGKKARKPEELVPTFEAAFKSNKPTLVEVLVENPPK